MNELERRLLNDFQRDLPLSPRPYADMAARLGTDEHTVIETLRALTERGAISRVGPVFRPGVLGTGALAALAVPPARLDEVAARVSAYPEVNHNYQREHRYNLWFVATAANADSLAAVLDDIERHAAAPMLRLPLVEDYHIDLGFPLTWS